MLYVIGATKSVPNARRTLRTSYFLVRLQRKGTTWRLHTHTVNRRFQSPQKIHTKIIKSLCSTENLLSSKSASVDPKQKTPHQRMFFSFQRNSLKNPSWVRSAAQTRQNFQTFCLQRDFTFYYISARLHMEHTHTHVFTGKRNTEHILAVPSRFTYCFIWVSVKVPSCTQRSFSHDSGSSSNGIKISPLHCGWSH